MILSRNTETLPYGEDLVVDDVAISYQSLLNSAEARAEFGVTIVEPAAPTLADQAEGKLAALADRRWQACQAFAYDGEVNVPADPAVSVITATLTMRQRRGVPAAYPQQWKLKSPGVFRSWDEPAIEAYGFAIGDHIQAAFDREAALTGQIGAALAAMDEAALEAIDIEAGWPG